MWAPLRKLFATTGVPSWLRACFPFCSFKRGATGAEVPFHHRCRSRQIFGGRKDFARISPNLPEKFFCAIFASKFSPTKIMKTSFWCNLQKKVFMYFYANLGRHFMKSNNVERYFYPDFQGFCPDFQLINTYGVALATPAPTPPTPLLSITVS